MKKQKLRKLTVEVTEICLGFCDSVGTLSDPLVWLLLQQTILLGEVYGDSGELCDLGLRNLFANITIQITDPGAN